MVGTLPSMPPFHFPKPDAERTVLRSALQNVPPSPGAKYSPPGGYWRDLPKDVAEEYLGSLWLESKKKGGSTDETRPFTVREYARIQGFPDSWEFAGSMASQYRQIGNACPVELARRIGEALHW